MSHTKGIVFTLGHTREAADALVLAICVELSLPACENLVTVSLVPDVPHYLVEGRIINIMEGYGQFNYSKACTKMTRVGAYLVNDVLSQLVTEPDKIKPVKLSEVLRCIYTI